MPSSVSRRDFLARTGLIGCSLAASPLLTPVTFAAAPWDTRFVVIILRGGMDGLDVVRPYGDPAFRALRGEMSPGPEGGALDLDGYFALHPSLAPLMPMWDAGQLSFVHAVSTPYRDKRSHFDGQDLLEAGTTTMAGVRDGWLNRMLQAVPGVTSQTAFALGHSDMRLVQGRAEVANWSPEAELDISPQAVRLLELVTESDPALHAALAEAQVLSQVSDSDNEQLKGEHLEIAQFAAARLSEDARIAAFSLNGWDTHAGQERHLDKALTRLAETLVTLRGKMRGNTWSKTAVVAMTEFGRTARQNGTRGTDHGTGGLMLLAGGAIKGGHVFGQWPGLGDGDLYQQRDLMPTGDVRAHAAWVMRGLTGLDRGVLEGAVFPGLDMGGDPGLLL
ncbi:DUF1501 domain-containing protein [Tateyamaria omphalii]|uniref:Twin-arginine translocation pathway signal n=1 Tax=Tateyamaria omphalii TaxID=299262 RepID=A0A1P8MZQ7_9RHOB|nr:DUF1501 domain-containing protein [Tateyamaria omphalii]APX13472.1 twin-arginine translocation pathway signal [Tateyamaria omphalii]